MADYRGKGTTLSYVTASSSTGTTYTAIGQILSIDGPSASGGEDIETTQLASTSNFTTFIGSDVDPGSLTVRMSFDNGVATTRALAARLASRASMDMKITYPSTLLIAETFSGYVKSMGRTVERNARIEGDVEFKISGNPGFRSS